MSVDPMLFIGPVKTAVKERVTDQSTFCTSHIRENIGKKVKKPRGQEAIVAQVGKIRTPSFKLWTRKNAKLSKVNLYRPDGRR
jgi:hypothetical protein